MSGFNLPPGVSASDLPGNEPECERNDGGPAFPHKPARREPVMHSGSETIELFHHGDEPGMSLRDYFAAKAMHALLTKDGTGYFDTRAEQAYEMADAMLKARAS